MDTATRHRARIRHGFEHQQSVARIRFRLLRSGIQGGPESPLRSRLRVLPMNSLKPALFFTAVLGLVVTTASTAPSQNAPDVGPHPPTPLPNMESHIGNVTGHAKD